MTSIQTTAQTQPTFEQLKAHVGSVHELTSNAAKGAINQMLTVRNWIIGYYIGGFN